MALANVSNQILRSDGGSATVAVNSPLTGNGSQQLPLGLDENYHGADGESLTFNITDITDGHRVTISGIQGSSSFDVLDGQDGANGVNGVNGADGQSVTFDITNIASGHRVTLSGAQGSASFDIMNGQNGVDGISPTFRFSESEDGVTVFVSGAQGEDSFRLYNGSTGHTYSAGPNIDIYPVEDQLYISAKDWTSTIESAVSSKMDKSESGNFYPMTGNPSGFLTAHQDISNLMPKSESGNFYPMTENPSGFLTAVDLSNYYTKNETSSRAEISAAIEAIPGAVEYSAGANIDITNHIVSGKDWSTDISNASTAGSAAATAWVSEQNYLTAHQSLAGLMSASKLEYNSSGNISGYDGSAFAGGLNVETIPVIGDNGISVSEVNGNVQIELSSVAHDATLSGNGTVSSPLGVISGGGKTYTGVAPIVVNNSEDKISANCIELSAGNGIDSNLLAIGTIAVSGGLGGSFESSAFGINPSQQVTALTSLSYYDTGVGNSNQLSGNDTNNLGWTMPSAYANVKNDIITETMPEVSSHYSYQLSYATPTTGFTSNSGLEIRKYVGNTGTTRKVMSGNSTLGELVPEDYTSRQYLSTNAAGNMVWDDISNISPIVLVATSGDIPASGATDGKLYVVTGT